MVDIDPAREWQRLTELYLSKYDDELLTLAEDLKDLTPVAQEVLQAEIKRRGLALEAREEVAKDQVAQFMSSAFPTPLSEPDRAQERTLRRKSDFKKPLVGEYLDWIPESPEESQDGSGQLVPKIIFRQFETAEEVRAAKYLLEKAGIESWAEIPGPGSLDMTAPRLLIAKDQLEAAAAVLPDVLPADLVLEMGQEVENFVVPVCPRCGAPDPLLESAPEAEQTNHWYCEICSHRWEEQLS